MDVVELNAQSFLAACLIALMLHESAASRAFTTSDVVELYLQRGAFEPAQASEDQEIDPDRWCSHTACGQEAWCIVSQWVWNLRLELGHQLEPTPLRTVSRLLQHRPKPTRSSPSPVAMASPRLPRPGKLAASQGKTLPSSPTGRCTVRLAKRCAQPSSAAKPMAVCA